MNTECMLAVTASFLLGVLYILLTLSCASYYMMRAARTRDFSKASDDDELPRIRCNVQKHDDRYGTKTERILHEPAVPIRGSTRLCATARSDGPGSGSSATRKVTQDCETA